MLLIGKETKVYGGINNISQNIYTGYSMAPIMFKIKKIL